MANPRNKQSLEGQTGTGAGKETRSNGHGEVTLFVAAAGLDPANDSLTVQLEGSPDDTRWDTIEDRQGGGEVSLTAEGLTEDPDSGEYTGSRTVDGSYYEFLRPRVTSFDDAADGDLSVDAWVLASGNSGSGTRGNPEMY